jgi:UDP-N-acetylglucosamine--N-acetylmuramyl-(pentapeptide) pyrophosphoryl-undecaprenol N-acetylglucosamine transferase
VSARPRLLIAGGGTGGHILAGVAIAEAWKLKLGLASYEGEVLFVGAAGQMEERLVPRHGLPLALLRLGSLNRVSLSQKILTLIKLPFALFKAAWIVLRFRPTHAIGVGGYASGPAILVASVVGRLWGIRSAILEQNSILGFTNRRLLRWVGSVYTTFDNTEGLPAKLNATLTGNPVRSKFEALAPAQLNPLRLFIFGGSQGARGINRLMVKVIPQLREKIANLEIVFQTGPTDLSEVQQALAGTPGVRISPFIDAMDLEYQNASLVIARAGSSTLAELARVRRASILIPLPTAADDQQTKNAVQFEKMGACRVFSQTGSPDELTALVLSLAYNESEIRKMERSAEKFSKPHAAEAVVRHLLAER